jgi:hypothetical protein
MRGNALGEVGKVTEWHFETLGVALEGKVSGFWKDRLHKIVIEMPPIARRWSRIGLAYCSLAKPS